MNAPTLAIASWALLAVTVVGCSSEAEPPDAGRSMPDIAAPPAAPGLESAPISRTEPAAIRATDRTSAQTPTEPGRWTTQEVAALALVERLVEAQSKLDPKQSLAELAFVVPPRARDPFERGGIATFGGYCFRCVLAAQDGKPAPDHTHGLTADAFAIYAWPAAEPGRAICGFEGGILTADAPYLGVATPPAPDAAFSAQAAPTFGNGLFGTGTGRDGNLWTRLDATDAIETTILRVLDPDGNPVQGFPVMVAPRTWLESDENDDLDAMIVATGGMALPPGQVQSRTGGVLTLRGVHADDLALLTPAPGDQVRIEDTPQGLVLRVPKEAQLASRARQNANQSAAIATLKNISSAQAQFQASGVQDTDSDGMGEYGFFAELAGATNLRRDPNGTLGDQPITPPVLSGAFGMVENRIVTRSGYCFQIWLPGPLGPTAEAADGGSANIVLDPDRTERGWLAYAWPSAAPADGTPQRVFYIDHQGDVWAAPNTVAGYHGTHRTPAPGAFGGGTPFDLQELTAPHVGADGEQWMVVH